MGAPEVIANGAPAPEAALGKLSLENGSAEVGLANLRSRLSSKAQVVAEGEEGFDQARQVWNRAIDRRPRVVVSVASAEDISAAVKFARECGLKVSIKGGGHSWCGTSMRDGALALDLGGLKGLTVDQASKTAWVDAGVCSQELHDAITPLGLAFPFPHCPCVPVSGFTVAGGLGMNARAWGFGVVNVLAAEVVLADGSIIQASPEENDEIFWALRGAGAGSFFVVTRFKFRLFDDCAIVSCSTLYPIDKTAEVAQHFVKAMQAGPPNVEQRMVFMTGEEGIPLVEMYVTAYAETEDAARELLAPYLSCPVAPHKAPHVYKDTWQNMYDVMIAELPDEHHFAVDNAVVSWDSVMDIMQPLADLYRQTPNPKNMIITAGIGYAGPPIDAAFKTPPYRSSYVGFYSLWKPNDERYVFPGSPASALEGASMAADNQAWVAKGTALVKSVKIGHSLTEVDLRAEGKAEACYTKANWRMLQELQKKYDPNGLFFRYYLQ